MHWIAYALFTAVDETTCMNNTHDSLFYLWILSFKTIIQLRLFSHSLWTEMILNAKFMEQKLQTTPVENNSQHLNWIIKIHLSKEFNSKKYKRVCSSVV